MDLRYPDAACGSVAIARLAAGAAAAFLVLGSMAARAATEVDFVKPDQYSDAGRRHLEYPYDPDDVMKIFSEHFQKLGARCIPAEQTLRIKVLDIRLAGMDEWWHRHFLNNDVRVMREATWPELELEYTLTGADKTVLRNGHEHLADMNYLHNIHAEGVQDRLPYERYMISRWFEQTFCAASGGKSPAPATAPVPAAEQPVPAGY